MRSTCREGESVFQPGGHRFFLQGLLNIGQPKQPEAIFGATSFALGKADAEILSRQVAFREKQAEVCLDFCGRQARKMIGDLNQLFDVAPCANVT